MRSRNVAGACSHIAARRPKRLAKAQLAAKADSVIFIWLPGGIAQTDTWDPKAAHALQPGMKGSELLGTCPSIPTSVDGLRIRRGAGEHGLGDASRHACCAA